MRSPDHALTYTYDPAGNRLSQTRANAAASNLPTAVAAAQITYDASNELLRWNNATNNLTYDLNENLATETVGGVTTTYTWNSRNRLTGISKTGLTASFVYDGLGRRTSKTINGTTTVFWYDGNDVYAELSGATPSFTYLRGLSIDEPYVRKGASDEFYETDALGSSVALTNGAGASQTTYTYEPFGTTTQASTASTNPFQFTGRENDGTTGLYYYRARYYEPLRGVFSSLDPLGFDGGSTNLYGYVFQNPLGFKDPFGLSVFCTYWQTSGRLLCECDGTTIDINTYSGYGKGLNNSSSQGVRNVGPIPQGVWTIGNMVKKTPSGLENALPLQPWVGLNDIYNTNRDVNDFFIHGPHKDDRQDSSRGCIIAPLDFRDTIEKCTPPKTLVVFP